MNLTLLKTKKKLSKSQRELKHLDLATAKEKERTRENSNVKEKLVNYVRAEVLIIFKNQ
jgi:hypothetical protein